MRVSVELWFCLFLPFFMLFVTETFAGKAHSIGLFLDQAVANVFPTLKPRKSEGTFCPMEKKTVSTPSKPSSNIGATTGNQRTFTQNLDHYDSTNNLTFQQRYFVYKSEGYVRGNPVYLLIGGLGELELCDVQEGIWNHFARESKALLLGLEHRMYGNSYPASGNWEYSVNNLVYLSSPQALADVATFIDDLVVNNPNEISISKEAKWIAVGSSYGGTLAVLSKMKFPHLLTGAVSVNAPFLPTMTFEDFYNVVENQCKSETVDDTIKEAFDELKKSFDSCNATEKECVAKIFEKHRETFNLCKSNGTEYEKESKNLFYWSIATTIGLALQFGNENNGTLKQEVINILRGKEKTPLALNRLGEAVKIVLKKHIVECLVVDYKTLLNSYMDESLQAENKLNYILYTGLGNRQTLYQHCSEWGHFETAYKENGIFAKLIPKEFYVKICTDVFGSAFNEVYLEEAIKRTDMLYGGWGIIVNNAIFINRDDDFWIKLGLSSGKPRNKLEENDSFSIMLKAEKNGATSISQEFLTDWHFIIDTLKKWAGLNIKV